MPDQAERVSIDLPKLLERLTGIGGWRESRGPDTGCGLDYWYQAMRVSRGSRVPMRAYVNLDQMMLSATTYPRDGDDPDPGLCFSVATDLEDPDSPYADCMSRITLEGQGTTDA